MSHASLVIMESNRSALQVFARIQNSLPLKSVYTINELAVDLGRSKKTAYRHLQALKRLGFVVSSHDGAFMLRDSTFLPISVIPKILPSLLAISQGRRFRLRNGRPGIERARTLLAELRGFPTLDHAAYELTKYQTPMTFYFYPDSMEQAINLLRENGYVESTRGSVVLLPKIGDFSNRIQRIFYDSLAVGGRGIIDAIAISRKFPNETRSTDYLHSLLGLTLKVEQDLRNSDQLVNSA